MIARRYDLGLQCKARFRQHAHGAKRDGEEADASLKQLAITVTQMLTGLVMERLPPIGRLSGAAIGTRDGLVSLTQSKISSSLNAI